MGHDVFISHSSKDKLAADAVCAALERTNVRCWLAPRDILPGENWANSILKAIAGSRLMVLIFSRHTQASKHIRREVERAIHHGLTIVPVRIDAVIPTEDFEYYLSASHWMDAMTPPLEQHLQQLGGTIGTLLKGGEPLKTISRSGKDDEPGSDRRRRRGPARALTVVALLVAAAFVARRWWPGHPAETVVPHLSWAIEPEAPRDDRLKVHVAALSGGGNKAAFARYDSAVRVVNLTSGRIRGFTISSVSAQAMKWSPDGKRLAVVEDKSVVVWDDEVEKVIRRLGPHHALPLAVAWNADNDTLAVADESDVKCWSVKTGQIVQTLMPARRPAALAFSPRGEYLASGDASPGLRIFTLATGASKVLQGYGGVISLAWSGDGMRLASAGYEDRVCVWDLGGELPEELSTDRESVWNLTWADGDRKLLGTGLHDRPGATAHLWRWDARGGNSSVAADVTGSFSSDGSRALGSWRKSDLRLWNTASGEPIMTILLSRGEHFLLVDPNHNWRGPEAGEEAFVARVRTADGERRVSLADFAKAYGFKNSPDQVRP